MNYTELSNAIQAYTENTEADFVANIPVFVEQAEQRIYNSVQFPSIRKNVYGQVTASNKYLQCPTDFLAVYSLAIVTDVTGVDMNTGTYEYLLNKDVNFIRQAYPTPNDTGVPKYYALFGPRSDNEDELTFILGPTPAASYWTELHYYYYPESIVQSPVATLGAITGGSAYTAGTYFDVPLTGGSGSGALATITVSGGAVTVVTITNGGLQYTAGGSLSASATNIGGTGSGFSVLIGTVTNSNGQSWLGDNFDTVLLYASLVEAYTYMKGEADMMTLYNQKFMEALALAKRLGDGMERQDAYRSGQFRQRVT
jgi:hypothetical protein